ncbi:DUF3391 domain-containing protein [Piscinibacter aquaticus]|uniref:DUF3391 domain-containing protein n=1 Tax=Piscinibacter aquaticus TaxID=392597 RepID=A0A5C6U242_9BURK|nr:DUF3391 domain-containing protein [Piscinibacter aquaticus]
MSTATVQETIDVASLRVGMFVHLDLGWLSHPFPLSSFRISSEEQIATIRALGLRRVRWSSAQSELEEVASDGRRAGAAAAADSMATAPNRPNSAPAASTASGSPHNAPAC